MGQRNHLLKQHLQAVSFARAVARCLPAFTKCTVTRGCTSTGNASRASATSARSRSFSSADTYERTLARDPTGASTAADSSRASTTSRSTSAVTRTVQASTTRATGAGQSFPISTSGGCTRDHTAVRCSTVAFTATGSSSTVTYGKRTLNHICARNSFSATSAESSLSRRTISTTTSPASTPTNGRRTSATSAARPSSVRSV